MIFGDSFLQNGFLTPTLEMLVKHWGVDKDVGKDQLKPHILFITAQLRSMSWPYQIAIAILSIIFLSSARILSMRSFTKTTFERQFHIWKLWKNSKLSMFRDFVSLYESLAALTIFSSILGTDDE